MVNANIVVIVRVPLLRFETICFARVKQVLEGGSILFSRSAQVEALLERFGIVGWSLGVERGQITVFLTRESTWNISVVNRIESRFQVLHGVSRFTLNIELTTVMVWWRVGRDWGKLWLIVVETLAHVRLLACIVVYIFELLQPFAWRSELEATYYSTSLAWPILVDVVLHFSVGWLRLTSRLQAWDTWHWDWSVMFLPLQEAAIETLWRFRGRLENDLHSVRIHLFIVKRRLVLFYF